MLQRRGQRRADLRVDRLDEVFVGKGHVTSYDHRVSSINLFPLVFDLSPSHPCILADVEVIPKRCLLPLSPPFSRPYPFPHTSLVSTSLSPSSPPPPPISGLITFTSTSWASLCFCKDIG